MVIATCLLAILTAPVAEQVEQHRQALIPQIPQEVVCEWIMTESSGNPHAVSHAGARGATSNTRLLRTIFCI